MSGANEINQVLEQRAPALYRSLSQRGRELVFPHGIPFQAAQAKKAEINATIGQLTDGRGGALPLPALEKHLRGLDRKLSWLYAPIRGPESVRMSWLERQRRLAGGPGIPTSLPVATHGLTHAVSLIASLFADDELDLIFPRPAWENYGLIFRLAGGARPLRYSFFDDSGAFDLDGLAECLGKVRKKAVVMLNFPNNPTGYVPTAAEMKAIAELLSAQDFPVVAVSDDAYQGWVYDTSRERRSIFWELARVADPEQLVPFKVDGATKELVFFSSRVGFVTSTLTGDAEDALESKLKCLIRGSVGSVAGPSLALLDATLGHPDLDTEFEARRQLMQRRADALKAGLESLNSPRLRPFPFHGAFFSLVGLDGDPEALRHKLLAEFSTGIVAFPADSAIRVAFCSLAEEAIPELVDRLGKAVSEL